MSSEGLLKLFVLEVDGEIVALRLGFVIADTLYFYYSGFHPGFGRYSVMSRLVVEAMRCAMSHGISFVDLGTGRDQSKLRWSPERVLYNDHSQIGRRLRSRLAFAVFSRP